MTMPGANADPAIRSETSVETIQAWDLPTRLFKWSLVVLVVLGWVTHHYGDAAQVWHKVNGYAVLTLLLWRLMWGVVGGSTARFSSFMRGPGEVLAYVAGLIRGRGRRFLGHNPLGALMIAALLAAVMAQAGTGLFANDDVLVDGPFRSYVSGGLSDTLSRWHGRIFKLIELLVVLHVLGNLYHGFVRRDPVIRAMITGVKPAADYVDLPRARIGGSLITALVCLVIAGAIVFGSIAMFGTSPFR